MNLSDLIIIYLACGSPVGVYFFLNNRKTKNIFPKTLLVTLFWFLFILRLSHIKLGKHIFYSGTRSTIHQFRKRSERLLPKNVSVFKFREIIDRYVGLSLAQVDDFANAPSIQKEFAAKFNPSAAEVSARCLQRLNRRKLELHHINSRRDFLQTIRDVSALTEKTFAFLELNLEFVRELNDETAASELKDLIAEKSPIIKQKPFKHMEEDLWINDTPQLQTADTQDFQIMISPSRPSRMTSKD